MSGSGAPEGTVKTLTLMALLRNNLRKTPPGFAHTHMHKNRKKSKPHLTKTQALFYVWAGLMTAAILYLLVPKWWAGLFGILHGLVGYRCV